MFVFSIQLTRLPTIFQSMSPCSVFQLSASALHSAPHNFRWYRNVWSIPASFKETDGKLETDMNAENVWTANPNAERKSAFNRNIILLAAAAFWSKTLPGQFYSFKYQINHTITGVSLPRKHLGDKLLGSKLIVWPPASTST